MIRCRYQWIFLAITVVDAATGWVAAGDGELLLLPPAPANTRWLQIDFQHGPVPIDSNPQENMYGLSTGGIMWLPDQNGISQSLREIIQQESLRILNRALPDDNK
jgi:hypothetical protein